MCSNRAVVVFCLSLSFSSLLGLTGCGGGSGTSKKIADVPVTTQIPKDDVSDLNVPQPSTSISEPERSVMLNAVCEKSNLVERDDLFDVAFDRLTQELNTFSFRGGNGKCAIELTGNNGGVVKADTYNRWDPDQYAEPKNLHFTIGKSNQTGSYCVPQNSVWVKIEARKAAPDQILKLRRADDQSGDEIWVSTFTGWKGTVMAKKSGIFHPMVCR